MSHLSRVHIDIDESDKRATRALVQTAPQRATQIAKTLGWACDARVLLGVGVIWWLGSRHDGRSDALRYLGIFSTTTALHHAIKRIVAQKRPDRSLQPTFHVKPTGRPYDAFPSGHAMHAGALASFVTAGAVRSRLWPWAVCGTLAFARVLALAHWPSGVIGGLAIGVLVERLWRPLKRRGYASRPRATPSHA